jgi:radical SAM protein with 4Fe4S-binding SPASM domain
VQEAKARLGSRLPQVILVAVAMRRNLEALPGLVRLAAEYRIGSVSIQHLAHDFSEESLPVRYAAMRAFVDAETLLGEDPARVHEWFARTRAEAERLGIELRMPVLEKRPRGCDWPWRGAYVAYSGHAMPCCMIATPDRVNFGNMAEAGVQETWNNEAYGRFREQLASDEPPEICRGCAVYNGTF